MLVVGDLGFSSLVLVVCLVFSIVSFVIRRKWCISTSRKEEIRRLLAMASDEAVRAELDDCLSYSADLPSVSWPYQCAVCYRPTITRCSRCKVVRYCSGKCQILHWRKGHKEECHPPKKGKEFGLKSALPEEYVYAEKSQGIVNEAPKLGSLSSEDAFSSSRGSAEKLNSEFDNTKTECTTGHSSPESSSNSFSGFSSSSAGSESSDDISVADSLSPVYSRKSYKHVSADDAHSISEKNINVVIPDPVKPLSPKFASLVDSIKDVTSSGTLNQHKNDYDERKVECKSTSPSFSGDNIRHAVPLAMHSEGPNFWEVVVDSTKQRGHIESCQESLVSGRTSINDESDNGSTLCFSFNLKGNNIASPCKKVCEEASGSAIPPEQHHHESVSPAADEMRKSGVNKTDSPSLKYDAVKHTSEVPRGNTTDGITHCLKAREVGSSYCHSSHDVASPMIGDITESMNSKSLSKLPSSTNRMMDNSTGNMDRNILRNKLIPSSSAPNNVIVPKSENWSSSLVRIRKPDGIDKHMGTTSQATISSLNPRNGLKMSVWRVLDQLKGSVLSRHNPSSNMVDVNGKCNEKGFFPYDLFINLYTWKGVELQPCGLVNCGNSCYANAVLQCLAFTPPLTSYFLQGLHRKTCRKRDWCFTCQLEGLVLKFQEGKSPVSPIGIVSKLKNIGSQLGQGRQEDAHEFLRYAIDKMQAVCLMESGKKTFSPIEEETTLIDLTFGGYFRSKIKCTRCHGKSERQERMMDLTVEIEGDIGTLEEALRQFTRTETLDGENKYRCSRCKSYEKARKKLTVLKAPNVLTIALKRFQQSGKFGKLNKLVRFPESLDLTSFMSGTIDKPEYKLYGVIVHVDIMNAAFSGHYVCYVKDYRNKWFKIDDSSVTPSEIERVLSKGAYMLFYARSQPLDPRAPKNVIIPPVPVNKAMPVGSIGKDPARKSQRTTNYCHTAEKSSYYPHMHHLHRTMEDSSSDNSSLFSSNSDESSCSTASTRDSTRFDDLSDYIFGNSSSSLYSRYAPNLIYDQRDGYEIRGRLQNLGGGGSTRNPFLHSDDVKAKPSRRSSSFSSMETDPGPFSMADHFGGVKKDVPFRRPVMG
ncbi:hypothetical protein SAY87_000672 [Trapa incisa]|uniref:ubiquitinyl hydrolase 1 n=1 Tax=Trapa incisa TaxID=236973 RepID=A0AAN7J9Z6_9MYRT|nr:hypothetical protein SAY87_000672 [Trapa incisa]